MTPPEFAPGKHVLVDLYGASQLSNLAYIEHTLSKAAKACGATVLNIKLHSFGDNQGVTGVAMLAESHISIHTWPELSYAAIDVFMCGDCDAQLTVPIFKQAFTPSSTKVSVNYRGQDLVPTSANKIA